ncbi:hypothetical protein CBR64_19945 [Cellulosimicrobium cellulans]|uniref:DUF6318 domain-containing protein n=1 Tax=Cellulosimicrobium cellulans TaxID=1710 RepID=A0A1Y0I1T9_CELCE|nr:DUF6318 family protein [Cellulosimicrobium cellulans]ARU53363.1 hypothetical protein CBR64_19945 [Cellulosimicrobium cellulans]
MGVVVAVGWVIAGCTGGGGPGPSPSFDEPVVPSPSESESESSEPSPTETGPAKPERPAAMDRDDGEGAAAAAEYFFALVPYVIATGDTAEWDAMSWEDSCEFCATIRDRAVDGQESGDTSTGAVVELSRPEIGAFDDFGGGYPVLFDFEQSPYSRVARDGSVVAEDDGGTGRIQIDMHHSDDGWVVLGVSAAS